MWLRENLGDKQNLHPWSFTCMVEIGLYKLHGLYIYIYIYIYIGLGSFANHY